MAINYVKLQNKVEKLLQSFGTNWILETIIKGNYNPITNSRDVITTIQYNIYGVKLEYSDNELVNELIAVGDFKLLINSNTLLEKPKITDKILKDGLIYSIMSVKELKPAEIVLYYELQLRL